MPRPMQAVKQLQHAVCCGRIQSCGRLIRQNHARFCHDRPCDCHPLLLSAGKLVRPVIRPIRQANPLQNRQCAFAPLMPRNALQRQRQRDIFQRCHARQQPELLKHKADLLTAQTRPLFCRQMRDCCSVEQIFAFGQTVQQTQNVHECAFARAGCAGHRNVVTVLHGQIDRIECTNAVLSIYFTRMNQF